MGIRIDEIKYKLNLLKLLRSDIRKVDFPKVVVLQTLNRCNCACSMCPYPYTVANEREQSMSDSLYEKILIELRSEENFETMFMAFQNEPLLDSRTIKFAKIFKDKLPNKKLELVTNGSLLTSDIATDVYKYFDMVHVSLNAFRKETHQKVSNRNNFEKIVKNLEHISRTKTWTDKTIIRFIRQKSNYNEKNDFKKYWNGKGFKVFGFDVNSRLSKVKSFKTDIKGPLFAKDIIKMKSLKYAGKIVLPTCPIPFLAIYIKANGNVVQCFNDWSGNDFLGDIQKDSIKSVFNSKKYQQVRKLLIENNLNESIICDNCDLYKEGIWLTA